MLEHINLNDIEYIAKIAGNAIMEIYNKDFKVEYKDDESPLTEADTKANEIICGKLLELYPNIPIMSEENKQIDYKIRKNWEYYWCIDPIDGTKEFINKNGEFTVNIALVYNGVPVLGIVYAPAIECMYKSKKGQGAFKNNIRLPIQRDDEDYIIVASRSHMSDETQKFVDSLEIKKEKKMISKGSSLKLCMVADGTADIYPRLAPTMEWDTVAADAIVRESGKRSYQYDTNNEVLVYNKENLLNPWFIVMDKS